MDKKLSRTSKQGVEEFMKEVNLTRFLSLICYCSSP